MTQSNLLTLAKQGNAKAIAALLNQFLQLKGITVEASLVNGCLQILLESTQLQNQQALVALIRKKITSLDAESIRMVRVYGQQAGEDFPNWVEEFELGEIEPHIFEIKPATPSTPPNLQVYNNKPNVKQPVRQVSLEPKSELAKRQRLDKSKFIEDLQTFQFSLVVPYKDALSSNLYSDNAVRILLFFGLFPLAVKLLTGTAELEQTAWILGIYYSSIWGIVLYNIIKPTEFSWGNTLKYVTFTAFIGIGLALFIQQVPPFSFLYAATSQIGLIPKIIGFVLGVGVLEESCKALPVYLFLLRPRELKDPLTFAFYGAMSGLGFAIAEGATYSVIYALGLTNNGLYSESFGSYVLSNTIRFVTLPLNHATWAGIVGYFLGLALLNPSRQAAIIFIGIAISAILHGLYDTFCNNLLGLAILTFSILLFVAYLRCSKQIVEEIEQAELKYKQSKYR